MADWNIRPRAQNCSICGISFFPESSGHSLLEPSEDGYRRCDLCNVCFATLPSETGRFSSGAWTFSVPPATKMKVHEKPHNKESAEHLLRTLLERGDPDDQNVAYILAILLERGRQFVERNVTTDAEGRHIRLYEHHKTGDLFPIVDPGLKLEDLPAVQQRVTELLEGSRRMNPKLPPRARPIRRAFHLRRRVTVVHRERFRR